MWILQKWSPLAKLILTALLFGNNGMSGGVNLAQFGLPPCCYVEPPPLLLAPSETHQNLAKGEGRSVDEVIESSFLNETDGEVQTFLFPMDEATNSTSVSVTANKKKRTAATEPDNDKPNNETMKQMPPDWKTRLRRVLFQSVKEMPAGTSRNETSTKSEALWERIYKAPLQVIDIATRREIGSDDAMDTLESMSLPAERISGVMVNTEKGIELRTSEGMPDRVTTLEAEESRLAGPPLGGQCNCHLIQHGDTLLAYWSVGFSGNNLEYLVYPLPHNVPTPPIFESFHSEPILRPSPIDLNPQITSRSGIDEVPFQPSLEFGLTSPTAAYYAAQAPLAPPPITNSFQFPPITNNGLQFPPTGNGIQFPPGNGLGFPFFGFPHPPPQNPNFLEQPYGPQDQFLSPNFGFGGPPIYGQNMFQQAPIPPIRKQLDEGFLNLQPAPGPGGGAVIGPLDPFNPNHPRSIQEILLQGNLGGFPGGQPPQLGPRDGQLSPGPNSGNFPPGYDEYPRQRPVPGQNYPPPRDQVVRTRPPGIYVDDLGGRRPEDQPRQPGNYNYKDRGISDRPTYYEGYRGEKEGCYNNNCLRRYAEDGLQGSRVGGLKGGYQFQSTNAKNKVRGRDGRKLRVKDKETAKDSSEPGYLLNF